MLVWHMAEGADVFALEREMGCTREEFMRWLPGATRQAPLRMSAEKAVLSVGNATVEIAFTQAPPRRIALLSMPVLNVSIRFSGAEAGAYREFIDYFDLYMKRGGG